MAPRSGIHPADVSFTFRPIEKWSGPASSPHKHGPFRVTPGRTQNDLRYELAAIGVDSCVIQADLEESDIRNDGIPKADARFRSTKVILSFEHESQGWVSMPCWSFTNFWDNMRAIVKTLEHLRGVDRYGVTSRGEQYTGWKQLPPNEQAASPESTGFDTVEDAARFLSSLSDDMYWYPEIINLRQVFDCAFKKAALKAHPDKGGSDKEMARVNAAREMIFSHKGWS